MATKPSRIITTKTTTTTKTKTSTTTTTKTTVNAPASASSPSRASTPKKATTAAKTVSAPAKLAGATLGERWITGPGDERPLCAPVAVGNSLLAVLGVAATDGALERLYKAAGGHGDSGVALEAVLAAAADLGLSGCRLASYRPADPDDADVLLLSLPWTADMHAAAIAGDGLIATWGESVALDNLSAHIEAAWSLTWHGKAA